jgi:glycosyltransferase involved in cell wall biosynthesis
MTVRKKILVILPDVPFPPRKNGLALRYYPLLQHLAKKFELDLAVFLYGDQDSLPRGGELDACAHRIIPLRASTSSASVLRKLLIQWVRVLPFGVPFSYYDYNADSITPQLRELLSGSTYDAVLWVSVSHVLQACLPLLSGQRLLIDAVDSITLHAIRNTSNTSPLRRLHTHKMLRWEAALIRHARKAFYISPVDLQLIAPHVAAVTSLEVAPNGILLEDYSNARVELKSPCLGFLGNMSYRPNIDAVHRLHALYASIKPEMPALTVCVIGRDPDPSLDAYAQDPDFVFTGTVDSVWPYVNAVDLFVMPMCKGAGQQNKLLEVMYAGRPVVSSSIANGGVQAIDGESVVIADDAESLRSAVLTLLQNVEQREKIGAQGARFVRDRYSWDQVAERFARSLVE